MSVTPYEAEVGGPQPLHEQAIAVVVTNPGDFPKHASAPVITEEAGPQTFETSAYVFATGAANVPQQVLVDSPLRRSALISITGAAVVRLCHSKGQADDVTKYGAASTSGAPVQGPAAPFQVTATGQLWVVGESAATAFNVGVISQMGQS